MPRPGSRLREPLVVWALFGACSLAVFITYSRLPASRLYNVSGSGVTGGASRLLVYLNFPTALAAIGILAILYERLPIWARPGALIAVVLCAAVFVPGVVSQNNLDARPVNAIAAAGVGLALLLTFVARGELTRDRRGDRARIVLAILLLAVAPEWIAAELGFFLNRVPLLDRLYLTGQYRPEQPGLPEFAPAVHHGDHHGLNGVLLVLTALLLSRVLPTIRRRGLRRTAAAYLSLLAVYGFGNILNDFWIEQIGKRSWTTWIWPSVLEPRIDWAWFGVIFIAAVLWLAWIGFVDETAPA